MQNNSFCKLLLAAFFLYSLSGCQKDQNPTIAPNDLLQTTAVTDRAPDVYGVTVWTAGVPSRVVRMNSAGAVISSVNVVSGGIIKDLKGICTVGGSYFVTTGTNSAPPFQYRLLRIDPNTGAVLAVFNPGYAAPISDICFRDVAPLGIYGLKDNSNNPVRINYNAGAWNTTTTFPPFSGVGAPLVTSGLTWGKGPVTFQIFIVAGDAVGNVKIFTWDPATLANPSVTGMTPAADFAGANLGWGYFSFLGSGLINRKPAFASLDKFAWGPIAPASFWGGSGFNFEDMCTVQ